MVLVLRLFKFVIFEPIDLAEFCLPPDVKSLWKVVDEKSQVKNVSKIADIAALQYLWINFDITGLESSVAGLSRWACWKSFKGLKLLTDPFRWLRLNKFYDCQKYKIKNCRPSAVERLIRLQQKYLQSLCKKTSPFIDSGKLGDHHVLFVCLFVWE